MSRSDSRAAAGGPIDVREFVTALRSDPELARELARVLAPLVFGIAAAAEADPEIYTTEPNGARPREYGERHRQWREIVPRIPGATPLGKRWWSLTRKDYERWRSSQAVGASQSAVAISVPASPWRVGQAAADLGFRPQRKAGAR